MTSKSIDLSIVVPAFNEEPNIVMLCEGIVQAMAGSDIAYEIIFVDDGSLDGTFTRIQELKTHDSNIKCIRLRRNFGKSMALEIGFIEAVGKIVVTLDADYQDDPSEIPSFLNKISEGWDLVVGWKKDRKDPMEKCVASKIFNFIVSRFSGVHIHDSNCGFKAYRREVIDTIRIYGGFHRFIPVIAYQYGFKICEIEIKHNARRFGSSKYGVSRYLSGMFDFLTVFFLTSYLYRPLHLLGKISVATGCLGFVLAVYAGVMKYGFGQTGNRPSLTIGIFLMLFSLQVLLFGLMADLFVHADRKRHFDSGSFILEKL